jgi:hypothetical protein
VPVWYVRPAAGGQFGPADDTLVQQWAAEGRIGADAYVWRSGWPDWRRAVELPDRFPHLAGQPVVTAPLGQPTEYNNVADAPGGPGIAPADVSVATERYRKRKRRSARGQMLAAIVLIVLAVVLAGVLFWVIRQTTGETVPEGPAEAVAPVNAAPPAGEDAAEAVDDPAMDTET